MFSKMRAGRVTSLLVAGTRSSVLIAMTLCISLIAVFFSLSPRPAIAADASNFDPGNIISDSNFYNGNAMSEAEIQNFLNSQVSCRNSNCLANYHTDTPSRTWSWGTCSGYSGAANESAARIIFKVQQACGLSAKVILVTLQKEQSLITSSAPSDSALRIAMGYACPDSGACDSTFYGFFNQVFAAARQLTWYGNPSGSFTWIRVGQTNSIRYSPNGACGSGDVYIRSRATSALYYYTPYQPNAAALSNLYGTGDGCSAYGNRNFWRLYSDWFGAPSGYPIYEHSQATYAANPVLGSATTPETCHPLNETMYCIQSFQNGTIVWSPRAGAVAVLFNLNARWKSAGGVRSIIGYPVAPEFCAFGDCYQLFSGGTVTYSPTNGSHVVLLSLDAQWKGRGGPYGGVMGYPSAEEDCQPSGCVQYFAGGSTTWTPSQGAHSVLLNINNEWKAKGDRRGLLGYPLNEETSNAGGYAQTFQGGTISYRPETGAITTLLNINREWISNSGASGQLGWPVAQESCKWNSNPGCIQAFQNGLITWTPFNGTKLLSTTMGNGWKSFGGQDSFIGYPMANQTCNSDGSVCEQPFRYGRMVASPAGTYQVLMNLNSTWQQQGGVNGRLGYPIGNENCNSSSCVQEFRNGTITWNNSSGASIVYR